MHASRREGGAAKAQSFFDIAFVTIRAPDRHYAELPTLTILSPASSLNGKNVAI